MSGALTATRGTLVPAAGGGVLAFDFSGPPQRVSASFNGTTQNLAVAANAALTLGTNDHTIEFWMNQTSRGSYAVPWAYDGTAAQLAGNYYVLIVGGLAFSLMLGNGAGGYAVNLALSPTPSLNAWHHYAIVRSGTTFTVYVDGVSVGSTTSSQSISAQVNPMYIGYQSANGRVAGYISNLRVANGTAVYTGSFTPTTTPLSPTGAALYLSLGVTAFVDYSTNSLAVTNTGTVALANSSPFSANWVDSVSGIVATVGIGNAGQPTYTANYGGGINIEEAVRPYVDVPTTRTGTGGYTISMAANVPTAPSHYVPLFTGNNLPVGSGGRSGNYIYARKWTNFETGSFASATTNIDLNFSTGALTNPPSWYDWVYNGTSVTVYRNGLYITSFTMSAAAGWLNPLRFAGDESSSTANSMAIGTLYRMKHQTTALSASAIATQYNTVRSTYGGGTLAGSLSFPGGVAGTRMLDLTTGFTLGAGSYTVEGWFQLPDFTNQYALFGANASAGDGSGMMNLIVSSSTLIFSDKNGGGGSVSYTVPTMSTNTWYHYALTRNGTTEAFFLNGVRAGTSATNAINYTAATKRIGMSYVRSWPGLMTNMRVVVGSYVYDPAFSFCTVPIGPLTAITNTRYLMLGAVATTDSSGTDTVTNTGSVTTSATKPF